VAADSSSTYAPLPPSFRYRSAYIHAVLILGFLLLTLWFRYAAPYENYFFISTWEQRTLHLLARTAFTLYFLGILFGAGQWLLKGIARNLGHFSLTGCEEVAISLLAGSALLHLVMFIMGFGQLYTFGLLASLGALALTGIGRLPKLLQMPQFSNETCCGGLALAGLLVVAIVMVFLTKCLYFTGTGDYFTHYFHYYLRVVQSKGIWPNDVWYHFYISKGAGDIFFAMILSDVLAPFTVSFVMYFTGIVITYAFIRRMTDSTPASLLACVMVASIFLLPAGYLNWAEFSKQHTITGALFWGIVWAGWMLEQLPEEERSAWRIVTAATVIGLMIFRAQMAALCVVYFAVMAIIAAFRRSSSVYSYIFLILVAGLGALDILAINYAITGLADVTPNRLFWGLADQEKFSHWVSPFLWLLLELGSSPDISTLGASHPSALLSMALILRLDLLLPFAIPIFLCIVLIGVAIGYGRKLILSPALLHGLLSLVAILLAAGAVFLCVKQFDSTFRLYVFCIYPIMMLVAILAALVLQAYSGKPYWPKIIAGGMVIIALIAFLPPLHQNRKHKKRWEAFDRGATTIAEVFSTEGFLWQPGIGACEHVPPGENIWSSQVTNEIFESPYCRFETFFSYSMGPDWGRILFENADVAEAALKQQKLDYFLIDASQPFFDILPYAPLFTPKEMKKHFGLAWSQNGVYLITWRSDKTTPLSRKFFADYDKSLKSALNWADFPGLHHALYGYYWDWKRNPHWPIEIDPNAPRIKGWQ